MEFFISDLKIVNRGALKAFADVTFGILTVRGFRIVQQDGKQAWIGFPQITYEKNGQNKFSELLEIPRSLKKEITDALLAEYEKHAGEPF